MGVTGRLAAELEVTGSITVDATINPAAPRVAVTFM
jgi:hypothetical protein